MLAGLCLTAFAGEEELVWQNGKWVKLAPPAEGTAPGELSLVRQDLDHKNYAQALKHVENFLRHYPGDALREDVLGFAGDAELARGNYWEAYGWYERQVKEFPTGAGLEKAMEREMEIAEAFLAGKKRTLGMVFKIPAEQDGVEILEKIAQRVPGTVRAELALLDVADYHFNKKEWKEAADCYDGYLKLFPKSDRAVHAELRAAEAFRRDYRGSSYDETPLLEAQQRYRRFLEDRPAQAREERVEEILAQIRLLRAARLQEIATFYERTKHPEAARPSYRQLADEFADTDYGQRAKVILGEYAPAPATSAPAPAVAPQTQPAATAPAPKRSKKLKTTAASTGGVEGI
jgi:outer membrane protein assembly factor BamD (BamD/ComL family)